MTLLLDKHIFGIKWSSVAIGSFIGLLFILTLIYHCAFQRFKLFKPKNKNEMTKKIDINQEE